MKDGNLLWEGEELDVDESREKGARCRLIQRLGLDFVTDLYSIARRRLDLVVENVVGTTMSATGFVTFYDLSSVASAAGARLSDTPGVLQCRIAPEPRDLMWENAHIDRRVSSTRENIATALIGLGAILWSIPLAAIQAFATADSIGKFFPF